MPATGTSSERRMKLSQVADQGDASEFQIFLKSSKAACHAKYVAKVGAMPADAEDPAVEQISAVVRKVKVLGQPPCCDFAVWVPFAKRHLKAQKYQSFVLQEDGSFLAKMVPGPACLALASKLPSAANNTYHDRHHQLELTSTCGRPRSSSNGRMQATPTERTQSGGGKERLVRGCPSPCKVDHKRHARGAVPNAARGAAGEGSSSVCWPLIPLTG